MAWARLLPSELLTVRWLVRIVPIAITFNHIELEHQQAPFFSVCCTPLLEPLAYRATDRSKRSLNPEQDEPLSFFLFARHSALVIYLSTFPVTR